MNKLTRPFHIAKAVGPDNVPRRLLQAWRLKTGWLAKRLDPARYIDEVFVSATRQKIDDQQQQWRDRAKRFFAIPTAQQLQQVADAAMWDQHVTKTCGDALRGEYPFFSHWTGQLGWPPNFNRDPVNDIDWPTGVHWMKTAKSGPPRHDIKLVWEPSRFTLAYHLARAYRYSGDERWAGAFWTMFDTWIEQNPPQMTVAWGCGQETAFRLMAMLTGAIATLDSSHATNERLFALTRLAWQFARRIEANINYARAQKNNHAHSEALGLWTVGLLFSEFAESSRWREHGRRVLAAECRRQIYDDGSFVQHSLTYHRVMMDDVMWCLRLGEINNDKLPGVVYERFKRATDWLGQMVDSISGRVPNYGPNDGANVLPLSCCDYLDYRPTLQASHRIAHGNTCIDPGPWDEKMLWLCGHSAEVKMLPVERPALWQAPVGGYYILRGPNSWLLTRCCKYKDRPHQADLLHVDLWHKGQNVLRDAGSFMYYHEDEKWMHYFHSTAAHNTVEIDGQDQMVKGPRFIWFNWPGGSATVGADRIEMINRSYQRLNPPVDHTRIIERSGDRYTITDRLGSTGQHTACIRWRLIDAHWQPVTDVANTWQAKIAGDVLRIGIASESDFECQLIRADADEPQSWESLYYGKMRPTTVLRVKATFDKEIELATTIGPSISSR